MTRLLHFTRTQEKRRNEGFVCFGMKERGGLYSSGGKNINGKIGGSEEQAKFGFLIATIIACRANFEKSYMTQF